MELNTTTSAPVGDGSPFSVESAAHEKSVRFRIGMFGFFLFIVFVVGLFWMATTPELTVGLTLSFVAGLSMIFLPCTLPLAFVIVPLTMGKDPKKGLLMALSFTLGLTITLSLYGVFIAAAGKAFGLKSDAEVYAVLFGGLAAFIFGLSEVGLINFKLPSYSGKFPDFIQRQKDYMKTFLLGLLLGNAGVGCPNPAFYLLLGYIATVGDIFNGWFLGFVHGLGRSVPLIFLAILGTLGVNALSGVARHKEGIQKVMGWMLLIMGAYLLTFGIFGHDWFIASGIHGWWEQFVVNISGERFGETILQHEHKLVDVPNFIQYGNMFFLGLLVLTFLAAFIFKRPSRRTILWLSITYIIIALTIGYSTAWTFKIGTNMHIQFQGVTDAGHEAGGAIQMGGEDAHEGHGETAYHEENDVRNGLAVNLNVIPASVLAGTSMRLDFFVNEKPGNVPIPVEDLDIEHTKPMHVIGVRDDMNEFFHVHPGLPFVRHSLTPPSSRLGGWNVFEAWPVLMYYPPGWKHESEKSELRLKTDEGDYGEEYGNNIDIPSGGAVLRIVSLMVSTPIDEIISESTAGAVIDSRKEVIIGGRKGIQVTYKHDRSFSGDVYHRIVTFYVAYELPSLEVLLPPPPPGSSASPTDTRKTMRVPQSTVNVFSLQYRDNDLREGEILSDFMKMVDTLSFFTYSKEDQLGQLSIGHTFSKPGRYKVWSEIKKDGVNHAFGHPEISVAGEGARDEKKVSFGRNIIVGQYQVALKMDEPVVKGHEHELSFDVHTFTGDEVEVEDYLAAKMHLTIIKDDWKQFIHTHPEEGDHHGSRLVPEAYAHGDEEIPGAIHEEGKDETINFHAAFPEAGLYKVFAQFRPKGIDLLQDEALTASFWIKVEEKAPSVISPWWINLLWSVIAIILLSVAVKKYLKKPI